MITLYDYFQSSTCYRVRIALAMKGLEYKSVKVDLLKGEQLADEYRESVNPQGAVPYLVDGDTKLGQSMAIIEYLDEKYPDTQQTVFGSPEDRAYIRHLAQAVACDIHIMSHPKVFKGYLMGTLGVSESDALEWVRHWVHNGLRGYEDTLAKSGKAGVFSFGDAPSLADICLIPQLRGARRNKINLSDFPKILEIERNCIKLDSFQKAAPEAHEDAPADLEQIHGVNSPLLTGDLSEAV